MGMALLSSGGGGTIVVGDTIRGRVYRVNMNNGDHSVVFQHTSLLANGPPGIGVNGLKVQQGHLYFTNTLQDTLSKVRIDPSTGVPTGPVRVMTRSVFSTNDFAFDMSGSAYVAANIM